MSRNYIGTIVVVAIVIQVNGGHWKSVAMVSSRFSCYYGNDRMGEDPEIR